VRGDREDGLSQRTTVITTTTRDLRRWHGSILITAAAVVTPLLRMEVVQYRSMPIIISPSTTTNTGVAVEAVEAEDEAPSAVEDQAPAVRSDPMKTRMAETVRTIPKRVRLRLRRLVLPHSSVHSFRGVAAEEVRWDIREEDHSIEVVAVGVYLEVVVVFPVELQYRR